MSANYLQAKLPARVLPVTRGTDAKISVRRRDPATQIAVDWPGEVYMLVDLGDAPTRIDGVVTASLATVVIESTIADQCKTGTPWRLVLSVPGNPSYERPLLVGTFERNDGR